MTSQSSGGSGSGLPGVTGDGLTPGGIHVAGEETVAGAITGASLTTGAITDTGALIAGNSTAASVPTFHHIYGSVRIYDSTGNVVDGDYTLDVEQQADLTQDNTAPGATFIRGGTENGHQYTAPFLWVQDYSTSTRPTLKVDRNSVAQFQVDSDGVQVHGKFKTGASVTHTLGAYSGKSVPIYDEAGTLLGYMPLYA